MAHTCSAYCRDGGHACLTLALPEGSKEEIIEAARPFYLSRGYAILRAMPAHEADVSEWQQRPGWHRPIAPAQTAPWLIFVEPLDLGDLLCP